MSKLEGCLKLVIGIMKLESLIALLLKGQTVIESG